MSQSESSTASSTASSSPSSLVTLCHLRTENVPMEQSIQLFRRCMSEVIAAQGVPLKSLRRLEKKVDRLEKKLDEVIALLSLLTAHP
jgi:hypothetical protein